MPLHTAEFIWEVCEAQPGSTCETEKEMEQGVRSQG